MNFFIGEIEEKSLDNLIDELVRLTENYYEKSVLSFCKSQCLLWHPQERL